MGLSQYQVFQHNYRGQKNSQYYPDIYRNFEKVIFSHLIWSLQLLVLHLPQHIVSCTQSAHLRVAGADKPW